MSIVMKYAGEFMEVGDRSQTFGEWLKAIREIVNIIEVNTPGLSTFAQPIRPEKDNAKDLYEDLFRLQDGVQRARTQIGDRGYTAMARKMGIWDRLVEMQESIETAKMHVRLEIKH